MKELYSKLTDKELRQRICQLESSLNHTLALVNIESVLQLNELLDQEWDGGMGIALKYTHKVFAVELMKKELFRREHASTWEYDDDDDDSGTTILLGDDTPPSGGNLSLMEPCLSCQ